MAIDFPTSKYTVADGVSQNSWPGSPSSGDTATANSYTYTYNGTLWVMNNGSTKSFTGGATYTWDGEKWDASNIPDNSNVVQAASSGWADGELLQYNSGSWDSVDLIIDEDNMSSNSNTKIPTQQSVKSYVDTSINNLVDSAPATLDTLNELAAALGDDANFSTTVTNSIATKLPLSGGTMTGNIVMSGTETVDGRDLSVDGAKLDLIEAGATGDQTAAEIKSAYESNNDTNAYTDAEKTKLSGIEAGATADQTNAEIKTAYESNADTNAFTNAEKTKLTGVEAGATADQTDTEIKTAYESNADTNAFTDAEKTKLTGIEAGATADQTAAEIRTLVESANDSNVFTDADHTKLNGIEANATADQTAAEIRTLVESATDSNVFTDVEKTKLTGIEAGATADQTAAEIRTLVESATDSNVFTDADHTKLNGIAAGAEVNVATNLGQTTGTNSLTITSSTGSNITVAEASGSIAGLMSTTHHNKLDGIESGATADQTAAEIKSLYESNSNTNEFSDAEQTKLAGIETGADVTDATNVNAAGAVMNSDTSTASMSFVVDEDNMSSNSPSKVPTQQSVKSYVDNQVASVVDSAPAALDTLNELAAALGDDANFSTTIATSIGEKLPLAGGTMTGAIAMSSNKITGLGTPTASTDASTKGYVDTQISASGSGTVTSVSGISPISVTNGTSTPAISISAATTSAAGTMSSSDKSKLNGIEAGATADQTAAEIKTAYESNANTNEFSDAEQTKLAGIEANADVTDATNVNAAGAVMNSDTSTASMSFVIDEDNMSSNSATKVPTQQSVKTYVDNEISGVSSTTNLSTTTTSTAVTVASSTGTNATIAGVTTSNAGVMSASDKSKLNGIESGATADQTASEIKTAYESNSNTNAYTDGEKFKLLAIAANANLYQNSDVDVHLNTSSASSGDSLTWNGSDYAWSAASGGGSADVQEFTSSGTWTKPSGCTIVEVYVFGAGGGGGGGGTSGGAITGGFAGPTFIRSGGGGGGSFVKYRFEASDLGSTVSVTIGAGGSGGNGTSSTTTYNHGTAGGDSSFGTLVAKGGMGGPAAALIPNSYVIEQSSIVTAYNYLGALSSTDRIPHQSFANWLQYAYPITSISANTTAQADLPTAGGCGGGLIDYQNGTSTTAGLGAQGMFAEFHTTGMNSVTAYQGVNAGAVNGNAGSTATNRFQSGNGGNGRSALVAAVLNGGNGGIAAGGGGGGSSINISMTGGDGGSGGNGYCIVYSW